MDISIKEVVAALALVAAFWKYIDTRARELKWRRTEFLFGQAEYLDQDEQISLAVSVLAGHDPKVSASEVFAPGDMAVPVAREYRAGFEKLINLLDRLAYAHLHSRTISRDELANFSWYLGAIRKSPGAREFCERNGFSDVMALADALEN